MPEASGQSHDNAAISITPEGHKGLIQTAQIGASVALRLLTDPDLRAEIREEHARRQEYGLENGLTTTTEEMIREKPQATTASAR